MAIEQVVRCDISGDQVDKSARMRIAVRRDEDRPDAAEYFDVGPCCIGKPIAMLIKEAESRWPETQYPHRPPQTTAWASQVEVDANG